VALSVPLLQATGLRKSFAARTGLLNSLLGRRPAPLRAVDDVDLRIDRGEVVALVGESGSGKTTTGRIVTLQERPDAGTLHFGGVDLAGLSGRVLRAHRARAQMIFQNPFESLDPRYRIADAVAESLAIHRIGSRAERRDRAHAVLEEVELRPASSFASRHPADLSGGQLQRVAIARALALRPELVVADEPVSMLDVSVRAGVMNMLLDLSARHGLATIVITHDLAVARYMAGRIAVMYRGAIVEEGPTEEVIRGAAHPYTRLLVSAVPEHRPGSRRARIRLEGEPAASHALPAGCRFQPRCPAARPVCRTEPPPRVVPEPGRWAACHFAVEVASQGLPRSIQQEIAA